MVSRALFLLWEISIPIAFLLLKPAESSQSCQINQLLLPPSFISRPLPTSLSNLLHLIFLFGETKFVPPSLALISSTSSMVIQNLPVKPMLSNLTGTDKIRSCSVPYLVVAQMLYNPCYLLLKHHMKLGPVSPQAMPTLPVPESSRSNLNLPPIQKDHALLLNIFTTCDPLPTILP